jgi:TonB-dependent receptor
MNRLHLFVSPYHLGRMAASLALLVLLHTAASAAALTGRVRDSASNSYLLGATVTLRELGRTAATTAGGGFSFGNVPAGDYTLSVVYLGYADFVQPVTVTEAGVPALEVVLKPAVLALEKMVVEGSREGQARALQQKRSATNVMDIISADAVGKFPDGNAAEALRRVPGISLEIDQDEGRYVVVRGIDSALNTVTLNNQIVGTPSEQGNRGVAMDSVPADLIARLEVVKAVTPDMDANSIGGAINIVTQSAFDRPEGFTFGSMGMFYDDFGGRARPNGSLTFGRLLGDNGKWGLVGAVSYSLKDVKSQTANTRSWTQLNGFWLPVTQQNYDYDIERERIGANVAFQYRPAEGHEVALRLNHNEFSDSEDRQSVQYEYRLGTLTNQTATSGANSQGRANRQFRDYAQTGTIDVVTLDGKHTVSGDARLTWQAGASRGSRDTHKRNDWEFRSATGAFPNTYDLSGEELVITPNTDAYYNPANYPFRRVRFRTDDEQEDVITAQADYQHDLTLGSGNGFWKAGAKYISREKQDDRNNNNYDSAPGPFTLGEPGLAGQEPAGYFDGLFRYGPTLNMDAIEAFFAANPARFVFNSATTLADSTASDYEAAEDVTAAYALASVEFARNWTLLAGVRVEKTDATYAANELFSGAYRRVDGGKDYTNVLPGVHLAWRPTKQAVVRFAWTNTIGRPRYSDLAPIRELESIETTPGRFAGSLSGGNPELDPFESMNFDLSLEYYFKTSGILSLGVFHKEIKNPIYDNVIFQTNVDYEGRLYDTLTFSGPANADKGKITGLELNYQQFFTSLPAPFDGFGGNVNYTVTDSSVKLFTRADELPFFKQSDSIMNLALIYEKYGFEGRISYSKNDDFLDDAGASPDTDIYVRGRAVVDAKVSYRFTRKLKVFVELLNLTEEPLREFTGVRARENDFEIYKWKAKIGVNFNL